MYNGMQVENKKLTGEKRLIFTGVIEL